jgi:hypothetical protein
MDSLNTLKKLQAMLQEANVDCALLEDENSISHLLVYGGNDQKGKEQVLEITSQPVDTGQLLNRDVEERTKTYVKIQLNARYPFKVEEAAVPEVAQFLHFLNLQVEVPGFYLDVLDNIVFYRYIFLFDSDHIPWKIVLSIAGVAIFFQDAFGAAIEQIAEGKKTFVQTLEEIQKTLSKMTPNRE